MTEQTPAGRAEIRLREMFEGFIEPDVMHADLDEALREAKQQERERIRAAKANMVLTEFGDGGDGYLSEDLDAILAEPSDEEPTATVAFGAQNPGVLQVTPTEALARAMWEVRAGGSIDNTHAPEVIDRLAALGWKVVPICQHPGGFESGPGSDQCGDCGAYPIEQAAEAVYAQAGTSAAADLDVEALADALEAGLIAITPEVRGISIGYFGRGRLVRLATSVAAAYAAAMKERP